MYAAAIEAMEFVAGNSEALGWDDAPAQLEANRSLVPALEEQLRRAEEALSGQQADFEYAKAQAELAEAVAQLRTIERMRKLKRG